MGAIANVTYTLTAAVANAATFVIPAYPTGSTQASLLGSTGGKMVRNNDLSYAQGTGFTVVFGASTITVTNTTGVTLPVGDVLILSFGDNTNAGSYNPKIRQAAPTDLATTITSLKTAGLTV